MCSLLLLKNGCLCRENCGRGVAQLRGRETGERKGDESGREREGTGREREETGRARERERSEDAVRTAGPAVQEHNLE